MLKSLPPEGTAVDPSSPTLPVGTLAVIEVVKPERRLDAQMIKDEAGTLVWQALGEDTTLAQSEVNLLRVYSNPDVNEQVDWIAD